MSVYSQNTMNISKIDNWWEADEYCSFLHWMADNKIGDNVDGFEGAHEIIYIVEKPWKYKKEWLEFKEETKENTMQEDEILEYKREHVCHHEVSKAEKCAECDEEELLNILDDKEGYLNDDR